MIKFKVMHIPLFIENIKYVVKNGYSGEVYAGYRIYYVFGIQVAKIQKTQPWK